jgi:hypothetical protein
MNTTTQNKPLGYWLAVVEHSTHDALRSAFADHGVSRREWRILNVLAQSPSSLEDLKACMPPRGRGHRGDGHHSDGDRGDAPRREQKPGRPPIAEVLNALCERGWVAETSGAFALTDDGAHALANLGEHVAAVRAKAGNGIPDADYATTVATLERMARNLGWTEDSPHPRGRRGPGRGSGRGRGRQS